ncbi:hypothetical protein [Saccharothrix obliqua]|uniref:hypothetical protein n=1 Tax=Saccharothrix obliqua TaxID=2861747 RepID=UPI001C60085C|nr:hypothetical protein [Saccharothrix obliqua]MBW4715852.1 hypothetical protein [Saccharothrix obliqua]
MPEPDPFASPFRPVDLPGGAAGFAGYPLPMPADPRGFAPRRPAALTVSSWSWLAGTALVVVLLPAVFYTDDGALVRYLHEDSGNSYRSAVFAARLTPVLFALGFAAPAVLYVVAAVKLRAGRDWARVLLAVLGVPALLFGLALLAGFASGGVPYGNWLVGTAWSLLFLCAVLLGAVTMFLPPANDYVKAVR